MHQWPLLLLLLRLHLQAGPWAAEPALPPAPAAVAPPAPLFPAQNGSAVIQTPAPAGNELDALLAAALK